MKNKALLCAALTLVMSAAVAVPLNHNPVFAEESAVGNTLDKVGDFLDDSTVTAAVRAKILATKGLDSLDLRVETNKGVVELGGQVDTAAQKELAERVTREVKGVHDVNNKISVKP